MTFDATSVLWGFAAFAASYGMFKVFRIPEVWLNDDGTPPSEAEVQAASSRRVPTLLAAQVLLLTLWLLWPALVLLLGMPKDQQTVEIPPEAIGLFCLALAGASVAGIYQQWNFSRNIVRKHPKFFGAAPDSALTVWLASSVAVPLGLLGVGAILRHYGPHYLPFLSAGMLVQIVAGARLTVLRERRQIELPPDDPLATEIARACEVAGLQPRKLFTVPSLSPYITLVRGNRIAIPVGQVELLSRDQLTALLVRELVVVKDNIYDRVALRMVMVVVPFATIGAALQFSLKNGIFSSFFKQSSRFVEPSVITHSIIFLYV